MAPFVNKTEEWHRVDWQILREGGIALYLRQEHLEDDLGWLASQGYDIYGFNCGLWRSEADAYSDFDRTLRFSQWWGPRWGHNLDALQDCLADFPVNDSGGVAVVFEKFDLYAQGPGSARLAGGRRRAEALLDVLARTSRLFLLTGRRFLTLVQTGDPDTEIGELGPVSPVWHRREWPRKNRVPAD